MGKLTKCFVLAIIWVSSSRIACAQVSSNQWTWMKGDNATNQPGVYGSQGSASLTNKPGARQSATTWTDASGKLWLFGGLGYDGTGGTYYLNDLWKYDPATNMWTWIKGDNIGNQLGSYGTLGISAPGNKPGGREGSVSWRDGTGNLWLFGGSGRAVTATVGRLNDLWKYDPSSNQWTWVKGDNLINQSGVYGTLGAAAGTNKPGGRLFSLSWRDASGNFWLFGGTGYDISGTSGNLGDLWKYDIGTNQWTWIKGDNTANSFAVYGTQGSAAITNKPGARNGSTVWKDAQNNLWFFGGSGYDASSNGNLNDLWKYEPSTNMWTWMKGDNTVNQPGVYGTQGMVAPTNKPGARNVSTGWSDLFGNLWLFGGAQSGGVLLNDLWKYDPLINQWTWMKGNNTTNVSGVYGVQGTPAAINKPGSSQGSVSWIDASGNLWLLGGYGYDGSGSLGYLNSLWAYGAGGFVWIGVTSIDWMAASNWSGGVVPGINDNIIIPAGTPFSPTVLAGTNTSCKDVLILSNAILTIQANAVLNITH
jgi:N-acetylneuraminic acid mutarotase